MEPLLDEDTEGSCDERNEETQDPEGVDSGGNSRGLERGDIENRDGRVDEVPIDSQVGCLIDELDEENICEVLRLLLEVLVRLDNECCDDCREQTSLWWLNLEHRGLKETDLQTPTAYLCLPCYPTLCPCRIHEQGHTSLPILYALARFAHGRPCHPYSQSHPR